MTKEEWSCPVVLQEFLPVESYRIRVLKDGDHQVVDIREFRDGKFTRHGIRLTGINGVSDLKTVIMDVSKYMIDGSV